MEETQTLELETTIQESAKERIWNNTDLVIFGQEEKLKNKFLLPNNVKNKYTLEAYILDLLLLVPKGTKLNNLKEDDWSLILKAMVEKYGFSYYLMLKIWPLTVSLEFSLALSHLCFLRLKEWKTRFSSIHSFHEQLTPNLSAELVYGNHLSVLSQIQRETRGEGFNVHDDYGIPTTYFYGKGIEVFSTFTKPFSGASYARIGYNPLWVPVGALNEEFIFGVIPVWMLSWLNWEERCLKERVLTKNLSLSGTLIKKDLFLDAVTTFDERNPLIIKMCKEIRIDECLIPDNTILVNDGVEITEEYEDLIPMLEETLRSMWDEAYHLAMTTTGHWLEL